MNSRGKFAQSRRIVETRRDGARQLRTTTTGFAQEIGKHTEGEEEGKEKKEERESRKAGGEEREKVGPK